MSGWRNTRRDNYQDSGHHQPSQTSSSQQGGFTRRPYNDQQQHHHHAGGHHAGGPRNLGRKGPKASRRFGLFGVTATDRRKKQSIPLKSVSVQANIVDYFAQVEVTQQFVNLEDNPIETTYTFPIAPNSAVCGFTAEIEGKKIVAEVKETEEAKDAYDDAISSGHGAYLGHEDRAAVFTVSVGNLPPGKEATIRITYVAELRLIGNKHKKNKVNKGDKNKLQLLPFEDNEQRLKFILPSRIAPKAKKPQQNSFGNAPPPPVHRFPEYTLTINVNLKTSRPFTGITSTQPIGLNFLSSKEAQIWLSPLIKALKYDFTLLVSLPEEQKTQSYAVVEAPETPEGDYAVAFVLFPKEFLGTAKPGEAQPEKAEEQPKETKEAAPAAEAKEEPEKAKETTKEGAAAEQPAENKARPGQPSATDLVWNWPSGVQVHQTSLPVSVHNTRGFLLSYCSVPASAFSGDGVLNVTLSGKSNAGPVSLTLAVDSKAAVKGNLVHSLFGRARIRDLERVLKDKVEESVKSEVVSIAKRYSLASHYTSFVAIEERKEATQGTMVSRVVPLNAFGYAEAQASRRGQEQGGQRGDSRRPAERRGESYQRQSDQYNRGGREDYQQRGGYGGRDRGDRDYREHRDERNDRGGYRGGDRGDRGNRGDRGDRGDRGGDSWGEGGRRGYDRGQDRHHQERRPKTLEVSADLAERLVAVKAKDGAHWNLTSTISEILGVPLTKLVDGLIGYPVSEYVSTIWATALVLACLRAHPEASKKHAALIADAEKWLSEETERHGFDGTDKWIKKGTDYLISIL